MTNSALPQVEAPNYQDWTGEMGSRWLANLHGLEKTLSPVGAALLDHAGYQPGERVLDIGCGGGAGTTPQAAHDFALNAMAFAQALQDCLPDVQAAAQAGLLALYERHYVPGEGVMMGYTAWLVTATA